jgi:hypothetical protein
MSEWNIYFFKTYLQAASRSLLTASFLLTSGLAFVQVQRWQQYVPLKCSSLSKLYVITIEKESVLWTGLVWLRIRAGGELL